jgi:PIN domain nuclease of toxin-antitoxin system
MRLLLDTHVFLWWLAADPRLSRSALDAIADPDNVLFLSSVSVADMSIKARIGRLRLNRRLDEVVREGMAGGPIAELPLRIAHAQHLADLPLLHRDPFDRLLVAQAQVEDMPIVSADPEIARYPVRVIQ